MDNVIIENGTATGIRLDDGTEVGARKLVAVPWGLQKRLYHVVVPQGIADGQVLRLKGVGRPKSDGTRGDMMLKIRVQHI